MSSILIWGAGNTTKLFVELLNLKQNRILGIVDNNLARGGNYFINYPIILPKDIEKLSYDILIVCSLSDLEILWQCHELGLDYCFSYHDKEKIFQRCPNLFLDPNAVIENEQQVCRDLQNQDLIREQIWSTIFHDTVLSYNWYDIKSLSLGRTAIGYNYAYILSRILNSMQPMNILEFGLGQSSKIINAYFQYYKTNNIVYDIIEHNHSWLDFIQSEINMENVNVYNKAIKLHEEYGDRFYIYEELDGILKGKKYNLFSIDGPYGYTGKWIGRIDLLAYIPDILADDWVILMDDYNRITEKNAVMLIERKLQSENIVYHKGIYKGEKHVCVLSSDRWEFFRTL